jgi:hypothetical protein
MASWYAVGSFEIPAAERVIMNSVKDWIEHLQHPLVLSLRDAISVPWG